MYLLKLLFVYLLWKAFTFTMEHVSFLTPHWNSFRDWFANILVDISVFFIKLTTGLEVETFHRVLRIPGTRGMYIANSCTGIPAMVIFAGIILSYPGKLKHKLWYIPLGMILVQASNVFRLVGLAILQKYSTEDFVRFNHGYTYLILTYSFVFWLVLLWMNRLSEK